MGTRLELHELLLATSGIPNVYFQPPEAHRIVYPCIIYSRDFIRTDFANNTPYKLAKRYKITVIDSNPDSSIPDKIKALPTCTFDRHFTSGNLNHDVFNIYF